MALKSTIDGENGISQYSLDNEILSEQFDIIPFKNPTEIDENLDYAEEWLQHQRHELAVYASSYFIESRKVEIEFERLDTKRKSYEAFGLIAVNSNVPLRVCVNMSGMRACLFEVQKQNEMILMAKGNIQYAWVCQQDERLVGLNNELLELNKHYQDLINEIQKFIDPEFEAQKKAEENPAVKLEKSNEITAQISQMLAGMKNEHFEYLEDPLN
jgi:hypothetical protein